MKHVARGRTEPGALVVEDEDMVGGWEATVAEREVLARACCRRLYCGASTLGSTGVTHDAVNMPGTEFMAGSVT